MTLSGLLSPNRVVAKLDATERWPAIVELVDHLVADNSLPSESRQSALNALKEREEQRSTGIGNGIAIPHCFSEDIDKVAMVFGKSTQGIEFSSLDRAPVHYVVLFIVPQNQYTLHLKTLAAIAKILNRDETRDRLAKAVDREDILAVLSRKPAQA